MRSSRPRQVRRSLVAVGGALLATAVAACSSDAAAPQPDPDEEVGTTAAALVGTRTPVGLAIDVDNGVGTPLKVRRGQTFYLNQIDMRASLSTSVDEGIEGLATTGDFKDLQWEGDTLADEQNLVFPNADGTSTRQRFYRNAKWMLRSSEIILQEKDRHGRPVGPRRAYKTGAETSRASTDDFFDRRFRGIQWTYDCAARAQCDGAKNYLEEALVELRYALHPDRTFVLDPRTKSIEVSWAIPGGHTYSIPVEQVECAEWDYGFKIDMKAQTPPRHDGTYAPGSDITYRVTLRDGNGKRLHPVGSLPTYNDVHNGKVESGIVYYNAFFDATTTYYRRKHRERMFMSQIIGPAQDIKPIRSFIELAGFLDPDVDVQTVGTEARDGVYSQFRTIPTGHDLFGQNWDAPVPDSWTYHIPDDAKPGTYLITTKARRVYLGEDIPATATIEIQVGTRQHTEPTLTTGGCQTCHNGASSFSKILHGNDNRAACNGCHVPLGMEYEGPIYVRTHFIHSRSERVGMDLSECKNCHLSKESIQRGSKSACLSCHKSYPDWHVAKFGPIDHMYVGGGRESFDSCTQSCHTNHPNSGLN